MADWYYAKNGQQQGPDLPRNEEVIAWYLHKRIVSLGRPLQSTTDPGSCFSRRVDRTIAG